MKVVLVADVHLGNHKVLGGSMVRGMNARCRASLLVWKAVFDLARAERADRVIVAGDLFDTDSPPPSLVFEVQKRIAEHANYGVETVLLLGNHEQATSEESNHSLAPLWGQAMVVDSDDVMGGIAYMPYRYAPTREWFSETLSLLSGSLYGEFETLVMHLGVEGAETKKWLKGAQDSVHIDDLVKLCESIGVSRVFTGHWHDAQDWESGSVKVSQIGALIPTGFDNAGLSYGRCVVYDTETGEADFKNIPGPRFLVVPFESLDLDKIAECARFGQIYLRVDAAGADLQRAVAAVMDAKAEGIIVDGVALPRAKEAKAAARFASFTAKQEDTIDGAVAAYVGEMELPDGADREDVARRVTEYLRSGQTREV